MDRRVGLVIMLLLSGCGCARDQVDADKGVPEYFSGCWEVFESKKVREDAKYRKENSKIQNEKQGVGDK